MSVQPFMSLSISMSMSVFMSVSVFMFMFTCDARLVYKKTNSVEGEGAKVLQNCFLLTALQI
jgi:hypothetical protein